MKLKIKLGILIVLLVSSFNGVIGQDKIPFLLQQYQADKGSLERFYVIDASPERRNRFIDFNKDYLNKLTTYSFNTLSQSDKVDYLLFKSQLNAYLTDLNEEEANYQKTKNWLDFAAIIYAQEKARRRGASIDAEKTALSWNRLNKELSVKMMELEKAPLLAKPMAMHINKTIKGYKKALKSINDFYNGYDPMYSWWTAQSLKKLDSAFDQYQQLTIKRTDAATSQKLDKSGIVGNPIGADAIENSLHNAFIPYNAQELIKIAEKEFAWCDAEMLKASRELGFGDNWKAALEKVKNTYVPVGKQPEMIMDLYNQSIDFIKKNDMITIPPLAEETWRMIMMTPKQQLVSPFFLGGETLMISYPTDDMDDDAKLMSMRGNNPHFSRSTVHHELIAGHHLEGFMNDRYKSYRNFETPFWTEGWSLYWEFELWDKGFPRNAEDRIGMLFWRMHRCARIIFSLNYHLEKWSPQECIDFLVDRVGHERANAEGEVRRSFTGGYGPLYQLAYMIGALQIRALKEEVVGSGKMTLKQFNDAVMKENNMPIEMLRALLLKTPLTENYKSQWRFYKY
ncbi:MAG: hypothetical protein RLZZ196_2230 [Bacteroidota bacterium]|jgi:uncharacterized protein (DUF885 family)